MRKFIYAYIVIVECIIIFFILCLLDLSKFIALELPENYNFTLGGCEGILDLFDIWYGNSEAKISRVYKSKSE